MTPAELCSALAETFDGFVDHPFSIGAAVIEGDDIATTVSPTEHTDHRFEIGSIGKTMTAAALSSLILDGTLSLDDPIGTWLDAGPNADITVGQLVTHTSGLPRLAPNHFTEERDEADPYANFGPAHAETGLREAERSTSSEREYSNFGLQLVGLILVRAADTEFDDLVRARIWAPLGMDATSVTGAQQPIVQGYAEGKPTPPWHSLLPGPGSVTSTTADMATYLKAVLAPSADAAGRAIDHTVEHGLAWATTPDGWTWHNGGTGGATSMLMAGRGARRGALALTNSGGLEELDQAVALAARGGDPRAARPEPVGAEFDDVVGDIAGLLVANDWDGLRSHMDAATKDLLTAETLTGGWSEVMGPHGEHQATNVVSVARSSGTVQAKLELTFATGQGWALLYLNDEKQLVGLRIG